MRGRDGLVDVQRDALFVELHPDVIAGPQCPHGVHVGGPQIHPMAVVRNQAEVQAWCIDPCEGPVDRALVRMVCGWQDRMA